MCVCLCVNDHIKIYRISFYILYTFICLYSTYICVFLEAIRQITIDNSKHLKQSSHKYYKPIP